MLVERDGDRRSDLRVGLLDLRVNVDDESDAILLGCDLEVLDPLLVGDCLSNHVEQLLPHVAKGLGVDDEVEFVID